MTLSLGHAASDRAQGPRGSPAVDQNRHSGSAFCSLNQEPTTPPLPLLSILPETCLSVPLSLTHTGTRVPEKGLGLTEGAPESLGTRHWLERDTRSECGERAMSSQILHGVLKELHVDFTSVYLGRAKVRQRSRGTTSMLAWKCHLSRLSLVIKGKEAPKGTA